MTYDRTNVWKDLYLSNRAPDFKLTPKIATSTETFSPNVSKRLIHKRSTTARGKATALAVSSAVAVVPENAFIKKATSYYRDTPKCLTDNTFDKTRYKRSQQIVLDKDWGEAIVTALDSSGVRHDSIGSLVIMPDFDLKIALRLGDVISPECLTVYSGNKTRPKDLARAIELFGGTLADIGMEGEALEEVVENIRGKDLLDAVPNLSGLRYSHMSPTLKTFKIIGDAACQLQRLVFHSDNIDSEQVDKLVSNISYGLRNRNEYIEKLLDYLQISNITTKTGKEYCPDRICWITNWLYATVWNTMNINFEHPLTPNYTSRETALKCFILSVVEANKINSLRKYESTSPLSYGQQLYFGDFTIKEIEDRFKSDMNHMISLRRITAYDYNKNNINEVLLRPDGNYLMGYHNYKKLRLRLNDYEDNTKV